MPDDLHTLRQTLEREPGIRQAIVFGSVASARAAPHSDLDIAVDLGRPMSAERKMALIATLAQASGRPVDVADLRSVGVPLLGQILKRGARILGDDTDYAELLRRHIFDSEDLLPCTRRLLRERRQRWIGTS